MQKTGFIDRIIVKDPCSQEWETMRGNESVRFCDHCSKNVNNLSAVTRKDAKKIVRASGGNICIRYIKHPETGRPVYLDQLVQIRRRAPMIAAGVVSASMSLANFTYAQGGAARPESPAESTTQKAGTDDIDKEKEPARGVVTGRIVDPHGAVIPAAAVTLTGDKASEIRRAISNAEGAYRVENVLPGKYIMQVELQGFAEFTAIVVIPEQEDTAIDVPLSVGSIEVEVEIRLDAEIEVAISGGAMFIEYTNDLVRAAANGDIDEVRTLLAKGHDVNGDPNDDDRTTPLGAAVENGELEIVRLLLKHGADVNLEGGSKRTPLMMVDDDSTAELAELLLSYGAEVERKDEDGNTALILAAENANPEIVEALLRANASVNETNKEGRSALMQAAYEEEIEIVRLLLQAGADVNLEDKEGDTAWDLAENDEIEELLVQHGARPRIATGETETDGQ